MAEFKLGRIRFVWKDAWTTNTGYLVDDVVRVGGKSYICVKNHVSSALFTTDLNTAPTFWNLISDGATWRGDWELNTYYNVGDQVKYGGVVYICNTAHFSAATTILGLENDQSKWDVFAKTFFWTGPWQTNTRYRINDFVTYGGVTYICNTAHTSAATFSLGLESDQSKWDLFTTGVSYLGSWNSASIRYKLNDVVKYGANLWICVEPHVSSEPFDDSKWSIFVKGFEFENSWTNSTQYQIGDTVTYGGYSYVAKTNNINKQPTSNPTDWSVFTTGFNFQGDWVRSNNYRVGDVVRFGGYTYLCYVDIVARSTTATATSSTGNRITVTSTTGFQAGQSVEFTGTTFGGIQTGVTYYVLSVIDATGFTVSLLPGGSAVTLSTASGSMGVVVSPQPPNATFWNRLNPGLQWTNNPETYSAIGGTNISGSGVNATFNVTRTNTVYTVTRQAGGTGYANGNQIRILGSNIGGISPANDLIITVTNAVGGVIQAAGFSFVGVSVTWKNNVSYIQGDIVFFGVNSYTCLQAHTSSSATRPDNDTTAVYWGLLAGGPESAVLTTKGDIFYYDQNGPSRLPIGEDGQLLRVKDGYPSWSYYGVVNKVVYVAPSGVDNPAPDYGLTLDKPWKSVRYACSQIDHGYLNPNALSILRRNKQFAMKEVTNWITFTYTLTVTATSSADNSFTVSSTTNLSPGMPIEFAGTVFGGVSVGVKYFVREIINSTKFTISTTLGGLAFTPTSASGSMTVRLSYDSATCERDVGLIYEALIYDIGHGGTEESVRAAKSYFSYEGNGYITSNFGTQVIQTVAAYEYLKTLVGNILDEVAPTNNYQVLNSVPVGDRAVQIIDATVASEAEAKQQSVALLDIIIDAIEFGDETAIPAAVVAYTTISIKTGTYFEILPIVVPKHTALVGDELRTTVVSPAPAISLLSNDKSKSINALSRIKNLTDSLMSNAAITPTSGNTIPQVTSLPASNIGSYDQNTLTATATSSTDNVITVSSTASLTIGQKIVPTTSFGNLVAGTSYFVFTIPTGTTFTVTTATPVTNQSTAFALANTSAQTRTLLVGESAVTSISSNTTTMINVIDQGLGAVPNFVSPRPPGFNTATLTDTAYSTTGNTTGNTTGYASGVNQIRQNYNFIVADVSQFLINNYNSVWLALGSTGQEACQRDVRYLLDAVTYDMTYGGNVQTLIAGAAYFSNSQLTIQDFEKTATIAAYNFLKTLINQISTRATVTKQVGNPQNQVITGDAGSAASGNFAQDRIQEIVDWVTNGVSPTSKTPATSWVPAALLTAGNSLNAKRSEIQDDTIVWVRKFFQDVNFNSILCSRDAGLIVDALRYDIMYGTNLSSITVGRSYLRQIPSVQIVMTQQKQAELGSIRFIRYKSKQIAAGGASARVRSLIDDIIESIQGSTNPETHGSNFYENNLPVIKGAEILRANKQFLAHEASAFIVQSYGGTATTTTAITNLITTSSAHNLSAGDPVIFSGTTFGGITAGVIYYVLTTPAGNTFTITTSLESTDPILLSSASGSMVVRYAFDQDLCRRDTESYIDAIIYDLNYTGNYHALYAANLYKNAVDGSLLSDMFLVRNGTGVRNMTVQGLSGELTPENAYGTRRPTAGAYVSLDPGFGPNDRRAWVTNKSCYVQNVTTFGTACVGCKIDGALHAGGNKSIVSNDFTQILSDGIGVWCTGSGALTELVSVFSYYGYAGYLAEYGGKIRATNGNSSYGTWGVVAEGTDTYEEPINAKIDNRYFQAQISNTITDGLNQILRLEFSNAGSNYTNTVYTINGSGFNATAIGDEFRDGAVFETRLIDNGDNSSTSVGGTNYVNVANSAQSGTSTSITIAATDTALTDAYNGMRVQITGGSGVGQYANILKYTNGSKTALVYKDSFINLTATATTVTTNLITVSSNATLFAGMPVYFGGTTFGNITENTLYYVLALTGTTQFTVSLSQGGPVVALTSATGSMTVYAAGWDHVVPGRTIASSLDLTTAYVIEPRIEYTAPGHTARDRTLSATATWSSATFGENKYLAIASGSASTSYSNDGITWTTAGNQPVSTGWVAVKYGGGQGATATAVVGGLGGFGAVLEPVMGTGLTSGQVISVNIVNGGFGYTTPPTIVFTPVSGGSGAKAVARVLNGAIREVTVEIPGSGYNSPPTVIAATDRITKIIVNTRGKNYFTTPVITLVGGGSSNPATGTPTMLNNGVASIEVGNDGGSGYTSVPLVNIVDPDAKFVAISGNANNSSYQTVANLGSTWTAGGSTGFTNLIDLAYGNGVYVAVGGTNSAVSSVNGISWVSRTITTLGAGTWRSVTYGNGVFVAISTGNNITAVSTNGVTWVPGGNLPSSTTWASVTYGNGRFVAIAGVGSTSRVAAYSLDNGATWIASPAGLPAARLWWDVEYAQGLFFAIASNSAFAATSPDGVNWTQVAMPGAASNWQGLTFGNINGNPMWVAVSNTSGTRAANMKTGARSLGRIRAASGTVVEVRMIEPGSGYPQGLVTATTTSTNLITANETTNLIDSQPVEFTGLSSIGLQENVTYYVIGSTITATQFKVSLTPGSSTPVSLPTATISGSYRAGPIVTQFDPNRVKEAAVRVRMGNGALGNPSFTNRGTANTTATTDTFGDGFSDLYQPSSFITVRDLYQVPTAGANVQFDSIPGKWFKLVAVTNVLGIPGEFTAQFQINPELTVAEAPAHNDGITTRLKYSQVRLTGHDFLYIGTGNFEDTNYPLVNPNNASQEAQELATAGGRVFFTSTDQDGNFNVGNLFGVQQATGTATLDASAFNLSGLQSLQLGSVELGIGSAVITQFSTDPFFTANSDNIVPTQRAIRAYITAQIGGGSGSLNVNTITSGVIFIAGNSISTTTGEEIRVTSKMNFTGGIDGSPVALGFFMQR